MTTTYSEKKVLRALLTNYFGDGVPSALIWADSINDAKEPSGIEGKALAAVCSNLVQKGLVVGQDRGRDAVIRLTPAGVEAARA